MFKKQPIDIDSIVSRLVQRTKGNDDFTNFLQTFEDEMDDLKKKVLTETVKSKFGTGEVEGGGAHCPDCNNLLTNKGKRSKDFF